MDLSGILTTVCLLSWLIGLIALTSIEAGKNRDPNRDPNREKNQDQEKQHQTRRDESEKSNRRRQHGADRSRDKDRRGREVEQLRCPPCGSSQTLQLNFNFFSLYFHFIL